MTPSEIQSLLEPGDCLLYGPTKGSIFDWAIEIKSWHGIVHCEMYLGDGESFASRNGKGVAIYPWRNTELVYILRPQARLNWRAFDAWFETVDGQKYDWFGLLRFAWIKQVGSGNNGRQFCSEALYRAYRALGANVLSSSDDADAIAPFEFLLSPTMTVIATAASLGTARK